MSNIVFVAELVAVHPHGRGDNALLPALDCEENGSPPRAWGQYTVPHHHLAPERFTPTGVGTMAVLSLLHAQMAVHPHGRGDNRRSSARVRRRPGSPPRAWGQYARYRSSADAARFTPTGVGTMAFSARSAAAKPVHPHGRGDKGPGTYSHNYGVRFTPTGVGTIGARLQAAFGGPVHPHGRGDNRSYK